MPRSQSRGGALLGIMLSVVLLGALGVAALVCTGLYVADNTRVTECDAHGVTTVETPFGSIRVRESRLDPTALGVPLYPGAIRDPDSHKLADFHLDFGHHHKDFAVAAACYRTSDSVDRVTAFYRDRLPHWLISQKDDGRIELSFTKRGYRRFVTICEDGGETRIALASMGEPASN